MPTQYRGNASGYQPPSPQPNLSELPIFNLPNDGEDLNASSILQSLKSSADWIAFLIDNYSGTVGIKEHDTNRTYQVGAFVVDIEDGLTYQCLNSASSQLAPHANPSVWKRWGHDRDDLRAESVALTDQFSGASCSNGASVSYAAMRSYNLAAIKQIDFQVINIPANGYTVIDLDGGSVKFATVVRSGTVSMNSGGSAYGGQVGLNLNTDGNKNKVTVWFKKTAGDSAVTASASVMLIGY
jgi:hypothetical protein